MSMNTNNTFVFFTTDMTVADAEESLRLLKQGIQEIQNGNASTLRFEELYRKAYTLVLHKYGDLLYNGVEQVIVEKLNEIAIIVSDKNNDILVDSIIFQWEDHQMKMGMIRDILMYMDKTRCEQNKKIPIYNLGLLSFLSKVLHHKDILSRVRKKLLKNVQEERTQTRPSLDYQQMRNCLRIFHEVDVQKTGLFEKEFESYFFKETANFYKEESSVALAQNSIGDYLKLVERRMREEQTRGAAYLDFKESSTPKMLMRTVDKQLVFNHLDFIVENQSSGSVVMFSENRMEDLQLLYRICEEVDRRCEKGNLKNSKANKDGPAMTQLGDAFQAYVYEQGKRIVDDPENRQNPFRFVQQVLDLLKKHQTQVENCFSNRPSLNVKHNETFVKFINKDMCAAKYLSMFVDNLMRNHQSKSEEEINNHIEQVMTLFKYIKDKDIFEDFYRFHITQRLLQSKSLSDELERKMIQKLKSECGYQYTSKLEGMFRDVDQSKEFQKKWKAFVREQHGGPPEIEFDCKVLTTGYWPFPGSDSKCVLPDELLVHKQLFTEFYKRRHEGRKLTFNLAQGNADLYVDFPSGTKELAMTTYQMCILMLFNQKDIYTFHEISELTQIPASELSRNILSLAHPKVKILLKNPNNKTIADNHQFKFNKKYKNQRYRVTVPMLRKNTKPEPINMPDSVKEQRKNRVEAAIVRIMKSRKILQHNLLVSELIKQLSFKFSPDPAFLKKRIESLIEREFLKRDQNDRNSYHYLA